MNKSQYMPKKGPSIDTFKERLDKNHEWPTVYMFKFIVPSDQEKEVTKLFPRNEFKFKHSKTGKYTSVTAKILARSSDEIIEIYQKAHLIEGMIAL